ncbi:MAG TPA: universal stress protein [Steroidobacteraceae bacterium]|nr:universal stress protein [Steroidobacteraceae bacterium]
MDKIGSILVLCSRTSADRVLLDKAIFLARSVQAEIHLFSCDEALARTLRHSYPIEEAEKAWNICLDEHLDYLRRLRQRAGAPGVQISVDAACRHPLYEGICAKLAETPADLIMKSPSGVHPLRRFAFDANDWQLMRQCPATLMLVGERPWRATPQFAAMVDVSIDVSAALAQTIIRTSEYLSLACRGEMDVIYSEASADEGLRSAHSGDLQRLAREYHIQPGHLHVLDGEPEQTLAPFVAHRHYDAVVLGGLTHREGLAALAGSLTSKLVDALETDFILVKRPAAAPDRDLERTGIEAGEHARHPSGAGVAWNAVFGD